ncbi:MAG: nucleotidyl transferase AbiEii/AbiGii toxin family protein [Pirellulales bacterium]|nr:nucleotidyl transferase AbiEii/AbiGii toxin family protein [Pirellulales bacterium]
MLVDEALTFKEFIIQEPLPLATIHRAVLEFLQGMEDAVLFGAQAVNAYVDEPQMTQDVDIASPRAAELAEQLRNHLGKRFNVVIRVREIGAGRGFRLYQLQKTGNRHLADIRSLASMPPARRIGEVLVVAPEELIAGKLIAYRRRRGTPKSGTDWRDLAALLLAFPELKTSRGPVRDRLEAAGATTEILASWDELIDQQINAQQDEDEF